MSSPLGNGTATVLEVHASGRVFVSEVHDAIGIAELVREEHLESLQGAGGDLLFWFSPRSYLRVNLSAAEMLWSCTPFGADTVPLLAGTVVVTGRNRRTGEACGLTTLQVRALVDAGPQGRQRRVLARRCGRAVRRQRCQAAAGPA